MILPQELEVFYVIPAIRRELALSLSKKGFKQKKIAQIFGVTEACISNYFKSKRANEVKFNVKIIKLINDCAEKLSKGQTCFINVVQKVCKEFKNSECLCALHEKLDEHVCKCRGCLE
ncbi:MAG: hypothetical protein WC307_03250 [Candidatus Nanoarchaeia archaeon]|jgi:predicted transcriptional regulator